jgi:hypothetical protein
MDARDLDSSTEAGVERCERSRGSSEAELVVAAQREKAVDVRVGDAVRRSRSTGRARTRSSRR